MKKLIILFSIMLLFSACNKSPLYIVSVNNEIENINSITDHKLFLTKIYNDSEEISEEIKKLEKNLLVNKDKIKQLEKKKDSLMPQNIYRVKKYLELFSYPSNKDFSKEETLAIYYAILDNKIKNILIKFLPELENAYQKGILDKYKYIGYLDKIYYLFTSEFFPYDKSLSIEEMIIDISPKIWKLRD